MPSSAPSIPFIPLEIILLFPCLQGLVGVERGVKRESEKGDVSASVGISKTAALKLYNLCVLQWQLPDCLYSEVSSLALILLQ